MIDVKEGMIEAIEAYERDVWKEIPGFSKYEVNLYGEVRNKKTLYKMVFDTKYWNYPTYKLRGDDNKIHYVKAHRAVALTFIPNPENKPIIHHKDEDKMNCYYKNLQWCTYKENANFNDLPSRISRNENIESMKKKVFLFDFDGNFIKEY